MSDWRTVSIEDLAVSHKSALATGPFGSAVASKNFRDSGVPMLRGSNLSDDVGVKLDERELVFLDPELAATFGRSTARKNDLVFTCWGTIGQIGLIDGEATFDEYVVSNKQMKMTPDRSKVDSLFLYYNMSQPSMIFEVQSRAIGSTIPGFNLGQLRSLTVQIPELGEQHAIAAVLRALDDKIAANTKLAKTSAVLAQALFAASMRAADHEVALSEVTELLSRGVAPKYSEAEDTVVVLNQKCIRDQRVNLDPARRTLIKKVRGDKMLRMDDVLVNSTGQGTLGRVARWTNCGSVTVDSHITIVRFDEAKVDPVFAGMGLLASQKTIEEMGEGSTGQTELSRTELGKLRMRLPERSRQAELGHRIKSMSEMESARLRENRALAAARDLLLPQLMSGKLRVRDAEKVLENAGV